MNCAIQGRCVDVYDNTYKSKKSGKDVAMTVYSVIDPDAFMSTDRIFTFTSKQGVGDISLVGKDVKFKGNLTKSFGATVFNCLSCEVVAVQK